MRYIPFKKGTWQKGYKRHGEYFKKILFTEKDLNQKGTATQLVRIKPGRTVHLHTHKKQTEVFLGITGQATIIVDGKRLKIKPGDAILCRPGDDHGVENKSREEFILAVFKTNFKKGDL